MLCDVYKFCNYRCFAMILPGRSVVVYVINKVLNLTMIPRQTVVGFNTTKFFTHGYRKNIFFLIICSWNQRVSQIQYSKYYYKVLL